MAYNGIVGLVLKPESKGQIFNVNTTERLELSLSLKHIVSRDGTTKGE